MQGNSVRLPVTRIVVHPSMILPGYENVVPHPTVVVYSNSSCGRVFVFWYTSPSWLSLSRAHRFALRVISKGSIDPTYWECAGVIDP